MLYNIFVAGFAEWLREKFQEWNSKQDGEKTYADFARYLGVPPTSLSNWINSGYRPRGDNLALLAAKYPEVYEILGFPRPQEIPLDQLPPDFRQRLERATEEVNRIFAERGLTGEMLEGAPKLPVSILIVSGTHLPLNSCATAAISLSCRSYLATARCSWCVAI